MRAALVVVLSSCRGAPPAAPDGDALLVDEVTPAVAAGGWLAARAVVVPIAACSIRGEPLAEVGPPRDDRPYAMWRVPAGLPIGPTWVRFTGASGEIQDVEVEITEPWFEEVVAAVGLDTPQTVDGWPKKCAESLTAVGFADVDLDGDLDAAVADLLAPSRLYVSEPDGDGDGLPEFVDASHVLGEHDLTTSLSFADYDDDGDPDLFLGRRGPNRLLENRFVPDGGTRFEDVTAGSGLVQADQRTTSGGWGDFDGDGDLDLYEVNHSWCYPSPDPSVDFQSGDHLYRNDDGVFVEVTAYLPAPAGELERFGFAALWVDVDRDLRQDLWVVNDAASGAGGRSVLWHNDGPDGAGGWRFTDLSEASGLSPTQDDLGKRPNAMGGAVGDVNRDGLPDFAFSNIGPNFLMESRPGGVWEDVSAARGIQRTLLPWGTTSVTWGSHLLDVDNDADLDVLFAAGPLSGNDLQPHALFEDVVAGPMIDRTFAAGVASPTHGVASAQVDLDGDGWLDWVVAVWGDRPEVWHNVRGRTLGHHWLVVDLVGDGEAVNRDALGAVVELERLDGTAEACFRTPRPSMASTGDAACHFGLGDDLAVGGVTVVWPDGVRQRVAVEGVDRRVRVIRGEEGR